MKDCSGRNQETRVQASTQAIAPRPMPAQPHQGKGWRRALTDATVFQLHRTRTRKGNTTARTNTDKTMNAGHENGAAIVGGVVGGILIGVFLKSMAEQIADWLGRGFHFVFDHVAGAPLVRLRYEKEYRATLAAKVQDLQSGNLIPHLAMYLTSPWKTS